jgi:hypothetical protein
MLNLDLWDYAAGGRPHIGFLSAMALVAQARQYSKPTWDVACLTLPQTAQTVSNLLANQR